MSCKEQIIHFFMGMGYRPAKWATIRDQYGDKQILIVGEDTPCEGKLDPELFALFPKPYNSSLDFYSYAPDMAAVPLPMSMQLLLLAIGALLLVKYGGRFGDWFCAERGAGEGKNGWV